MRFVKLSTFALLVLAGSFAAAQAVTYEKASILEISPKPASSAVHTATDAPRFPMQSTYDLTVQIGDMVYVGRYSACQ
jgi:hypothetical protein